MFVCSELGCQMGARVLNCTGALLKVVAGLEVYSQDTCLQNLEENAEGAKQVLFIKHINFCRVKS